MGMGRPRPAAWRHGPGNEEFVSGRRVLILSYYFPPAPSVGGHRAAGLAKYLSEFGWAPVVITPEREGRKVEPGGIVETPDADAAAVWKRRLGLRPEMALKDQWSVQTSERRLSRRLAAGAIELVKGMTALPDAHRGWIRFALAAGKRAAQEGSFAAVLSTSPPASAQMAGARLHRATGLPWLADLRDLWADDPVQITPAWRRALDRWLERRTLRGARTLVSVSAPLADVLARRYPGKNVQPVLNGFDPALFPGGVSLTDDFSITYTGSFYQGLRGPQLFFKALAEMIAAGQLPRDRVRLRLFSRGEPWVKTEVERCGLTDVVEFKGWVARETAARAQQESQLLLLLRGEASREEGVYTGKLFDYLGARRPILCVGGGEGVVGELLRETGTGRMVEGLEQIKEALQKAWEDYSSLGSVPWRGDPSRVEYYSQRRMAREFAALLDALVSI